MRAARRHLPFWWSSILPIIGRFSPSVSGRDPTRDANCARSLVSDFVSTLNGRQISSDASGDPGCGGLDRVPCQMRVSGGYSAAIWMIRSLILFVAPQAVV